jgi:hypothetical protein
MTQLKSQFLSALRLQTYQEMFRSRLHLMQGWFLLLGQLLHLVT